MPCYGGGGPSFSELVYPCEQLVPCLALAEASTWLWDRLFPHTTHKTTHTFMPAVTYFTIALLNTPLTLQATCMPSSTTALQTKAPSPCSKINSP